MTFSKTPLFLEGIATSQFLNFSPQKYFFFSRTTTMNPNPVTPQIASKPFPSARSEPLRLCANPLLSPCLSVSRGERKPPEAFRKRPETTKPHFLEQNRLSASAKNKNPRTLPAH
jgi:hypothetical protein